MMKVFQQALFAATVLCGSASLFAKAEIAISECTSGPSPSLGCTNTDPPTFTVTYPAGEIECQSALTLEQAALAPTVTLVNSNTEKFYTVLLVDTADSQIHPILHYGASNIPGDSLLNGLDLSTTDSFSGYRGPDPPAFPGIETQLFNYEYIVAEQASFTAQLPLPPVFLNIKFSYDDYLAGVGGTTLSTSYFSSGFCVTESPTSGKKAKKSKAPKSNKGYKATKKAKKSSKN